jgi:2-keto-3-deoxy-L-rhamnonate aldolase RhmA
MWHWIWNFFAAAAVETIDVVVYGPNDTAVVYGPNDEATTEGP